jgi:hypothetical protein
MGLMRRLTLSVGVAASIVATITLASVGAAGGFGQGPGKFTFTDTSAFANFFNPSDNSSLNVSVDHGTFMFRSRGGPLQTAVMTVLNVSRFVPDPNNPSGPPLVSESFCRLIPDSAFVVSSDLQTATLNAVDQTTGCFGFQVAVTGAVPDAGFAGGGGGGGPEPPLTVIASWTGTGLVGMSENQGNFMCGGFVSTMHNRNQSALSSFVTVTIPDLGTFSGGPFAFGSVQVSTNTQIVAGSGILPAGCGGGKGGG